MIRQKLMMIQNELKAPKNRINSFGNYNYRNAEDILEAAKPLCAKYKATLTLWDAIEMVGDRIYVKATACLADAEDEQQPYVTVTAYAREDDSKKGLDGAQITGTASSYARKYALNGMFCIDDTKDADTDEYTQTVKAAEQKDAAERAKVKAEADSPVTEEAVEAALKMMELKKVSMEQVLTRYGVEDIRKLKKSQYNNLMTALQRTK